MRFQKEQYSRLARDHPHDIVAENVAAFCSSHKNLPEAKLKSNGLISSAQEISRQSNMGSVMWLLITFVPVNSVKERASQKEVQKLQSEEKENTTKLNVVAKTGAEGRKGTEA